jgi:ketosteroid isomerase-like protein
LENARRCGRLARTIAQRRSNLNLLHTLVDAYNARDYETLRDCFHQDIEIRRPFTDMSLTGRDFVDSYRADEAIEVLRRIADEVGGIQLEVRKAEEHPGDIGLLELVVKTGPEGQESHQMSWVVLWLREGKVSSTETFTTEAAARDTLRRAIGD